MQSPGLLGRHRAAWTRHAIFLAAFLTYLFDPVDVVWRFAQTTLHPRAWERAGFLLATLLLASAVLLSAPRNRALSLGKRNGRASLLFAVAIAFLLPWSGACLLVLGELLQQTLVAGQDSSKRLNPASFARSPDQSTIRPQRLPVYLSAFVSMLLFAIFLSDRLADVLFGITFLVALAIDLRAATRPQVSAAS